jgi:hypothetical protein
MLCHAVLCCVLCLAVMPHKGVGRHAPPSQPPPHLLYCTNCDCTANPTCGTCCPTERCCAVLSCIVVLHCAVLCHAVQLDITKAWVGMHHPRSPPPISFTTLTATALPTPPVIPVVQRNGVVLCCVVLPRCVAAVLCHAVQLDITKAWVDMHHPRSPRATYVETLPYRNLTPGLTAGDVWQAALQYARNASHQHAVSVRGSHHRPSGSVVSQPYNPARIFRFRIIFLCLLSRPAEHLFMSVWATY